MFIWSKLTATIRYVLDGNAMGMTAAEAWKRRQGLSFGQPAGVVVSIGYPLTDTVYDFTNRFIDYRPPQEQPSRADVLLEFIELSLRPWLHDSIFPDVNFGREALFGHSFGGLFAVYALLSRPTLFDTYLSASPALVWLNGTVLNMFTESLGNGTEVLPAAQPGLYSNATMTKDKPALFISYGSLEEFPGRRRAENLTAYQARKEYWRPLQMAEHCHDLFDRAEASGRLRDVVLKEYEGSDHAGVAASAINDGIDYFVDWL